MGLRFSKSVKLPGGFRLNLSKSGVGASWGIKGFRISKTAKGKVRKTVTVPGTGISYVKEDGPKKSKDVSTKNIEKQTSSSSMKLKEVYLNEETGEIIEKNDAKIKEIKSYDDVVEDIANKFGQIVDK